MGGTQSTRLRFIFDACDVHGEHKVEPEALRTMLKQLILNCHETVPSFAMTKTEEEAAMFADLSLEHMATVIANLMVFDMFKAADTKKSGALDFKALNFWFSRGDKVAKNFAELFTFFDLLAAEGE